MTAPLDVLIADGVIDEVLGRLKSGKEADISLVRRGADVLAAKVYKDRSTRSFKNNSDYKEGRKVRNSRTQRAIDSGGRFGRDAAEQAWKSAEADALYKLVGSGVRVPEPVMFYEGVLLMELVRDAEGRPAPRLIDVAIERDAALGLYADLVAQIISMLCCDLIHGDLSPYNILAAADGPAIIDFPQVVSAVHSSRAEFFFLRDFDNVVRFLAGFDPRLAVHTADGRAIWRAYVSRELTPQFVPPPPPPPRTTRGPDRRTRDERGRGRNDRPRPTVDGRPQMSRDGRPPPRDGRPSPPREGGAQMSRDGRPPPRDGRPPPPREGGAPPSRDGRPSQPRDGGAQMSRNGGPPPSRDGRPPPRDGRPPPRGGGPPPARDGRAPSRDGRSPAPENRPWSSGAALRGNPPAPRSAPPPRPAPPPRRPPPPVVTRWSEDGPRNVGPSPGGRRRPKRRW